MAIYARKTCSDCGVRLAQLDMLKREVTPLGVHGNVLPSRQKWFCPQCAPPTSEEIGRAVYEREMAAEAAFRALDEVKKSAWREEQERRRLARLGSTTTS